MKTLYAQIVEKFLEQIAESNTIDETRRDRLRKLLKEPKKPKADDFLKVFGHEEEEVQ
jgi:hypothetical protein